MLPDARSSSISRHLSASYPARACEWYAIVLPSGEYAGAPSNPGFVVSRFGAIRRSTSTSNRSPLVLVASTRSVTAVKQMRPAVGRERDGMRPSRSRGGTS